MNNTVFQDIFDRILEVLPDGWRRLVVYIDYMGESSGINFYTNNGDGKYIDCFSQKGISREQLINLFIDIGKILAPERRALDDKNKWSVMTMVIDSDGNMEAEFDYTDISGSIIEYEREWKNKYLN